MSISDKTRKVLWGRSGNRCVICQQELVINAIERDDESVVGIECHIISGRENGPRHDVSYSEDKLDSYENLILLCGVHHKMVDDQRDTYTVDILRQMKASHEVWVADRLADGRDARPVRLRRVKDKVPPFLSQLLTGRQVCDLLTGTYAYSMDHDELRSQEEVDVVGGFIQAATDWSDFASELEPAERVNAEYNLSRCLGDLGDAGFFVFGGREVQQLEGGLQAEPSDWPVGILRVVRKDNAEIIHLSQNDPAKEHAKADDAGRRR
jgi:hypothetical protein